jgi:hypothetical protein
MIKEVIFLGLEIDSKLAIINNLNPIDGKDILKPLRQLDVIGELKSLKSLTAQP